MSTWPELRTIGRHRYVATYWVLPSLACFGVGGTLGAYLFQHSLTTVALIPVAVQTVIVTVGFTILGYRYWHDQERRYTQNSDQNS